MPSNLALAEPKPASRVVVASIARSRGVLCALATLVVAAIVSASTARNDHSGVEALVRAAARDTPQNSREGKTGPRLSRIDAEIEAVAEAMARKYRISQTATREFVSTAYREGRGIGIDPLLIIAVMAIESRFNPIAQSDGGAIGLMQVIPRYHADKLDGPHGASMLDPHANIRLGAKVLKEYIRRGGTDVAGLQLYNGASADASNAYANKVLGERQRLRETARRIREASRV
jgi:soluble lytic murein transglycosylase-like protein